MKTLLVAAMLLASPALADVSDDYAACLIGKAAVALHKGSGSDVAQEAAYNACPEPAGLPDEEAEGLSDFVNVAVEAMAATVGN